MADKQPPKLSVFSKTGPAQEPQEGPAAPGPEVIVITELADLSDLDNGHIKQSGVGLRQGEIEALDAIGAELGIARNALLRYGARVLIALYRAGRLDLAQDVETPPQPKKKLRMPGSKK